MEKRFLHTLSLPEFENAYLKNVRRYQKVVNYKNIYQILLFIFVVNSFFIAVHALKIHAVKVRLVGARERERAGETQRSETPSSFCTLSHSPTLKVRSSKACKAIKKLPTAKM